MKDAPTVAGAVGVVGSRAALAADQLTAAPAGPALILVGKVLGLFHCGHRCVRRWLRCCSLGPCGCQDAGRSGGSARRRHGAGTLATPAVRGRLTPCRCCGSETLAVTSC